MDITSLTMSVGETRSLTATISPSDAENQKVLWSTSNANVATVKDGTVSAIAPGEATVTVKTDDGGKTAECTVTVKGANEEDGTEEDDEDENKWPIASVLGTVTATTVQFDMTLDISSMSGYQEVGLIFSPVDDLDVAAEGVTTFQLTRESYSKVFTSLNYNTKYYYTTYLKKDGFYLYGEKAEFTTSNVLLDLSVASSTATTAQITGTVEGLSESDKSLIEVGMFYSSESGKVEKGEGTKLTVTEMSSDNAFSFDLIELAYGTAYYYCSYVKQGDGYVYGEVKEFVAGSVSVNLSVGSITATSAKVTGSVEGLSESDKSQIEVGMFYSSESGKVEKGEGTKLTASEIPTDNALSFNLDLTFGTKYYYCSYVKQGDGYVYGEVKEFVAGSVTVNLSAGSITATSAQITGIVEGLSESDKSLIEVGMIYSSEVGKVENGEGAKLTATEIPSDNAVSFDITELTSGKKYYYCSYVKQGEGYVYGEEKEFTTASATVVTIAEFLANGGSAIEGIVISNSDLNNLTSKKTMYIQDETAGLQFYLAANHEFSFGDKVRVDVSGVSVGKYEGAVQVSGLAIEKITMISSGNTVAPKNVTIADFLANKYEGQYVAIEGVQVADGDLEKTFVMDNAHTKITMEDAYGKKFAVFSSKYAAYGTKNVPRGSGTIKGISSINKGNMQIIFAQDTDFAGLTGSRWGSEDTSSANCYIVSESGLYKFETIKGNRRKPVGDVVSAEVLWETFGTDVAPNVGDLVKKVSYKNGEVTFQTADTFKEGNAVIAVKDASGNILWSWHIWFTDPPKEHAYIRNAGTMMDRNLGATSATPGDVGALGLFYQWGRKDPFLGASSISSETEAKSTITWPSPVWSDSSTGTITYATTNPTTFIYENDYNYDWYYTGSSSTNNSRWTSLSKTKSIYDPCPAGWRVPGHSVFVLPFGSLISYDCSYDSAGKGMNFAGELGFVGSPIWYPAAGRSVGDSIWSVGKSGYYWTASTYNYKAVCLFFEHNGKVYPQDASLRWFALSVRCVKE